MFLLNAFFMFSWKSQIQNFAFTSLNKKAVYEVGR